MNEKNITLIAGLNDARLLSLLQEALLETTGYFRARGLRADDALAWVTPARIAIARAEI